MRQAHVASGGRYPVLRTLAILYLAAAAVAVVAGVWESTEILRGRADAAFGHGVIPCLVSLALTFLSFLVLVAVAEGIKLVIDIERNTRMMSMNASAASPDDAPQEAGRAWNGGGRRTILEGEETAEGALLRGS